MSEFKKHTGDRHEGPARTSPYPISRLAPAHDLVDIARHIQEADEKLGIATSSKLQMIAEQIQALQARAREVLAQSARDVQLHHARCSFKRRPGQVYHLYQSDEESYFSMLSPEDWGTPPHEFLGSYRLELDMSFTNVSESSEAE